MSDCLICKRIQMIKENKNKMYSEDSKPTEEELENMKNKLYSESIKSTKF